MQNLLKSNLKYVQVASLVGGLALLGCCLSLNIAYDNNDGCSISYTGFLNCSSAENNSFSEKYTCDGDNECNALTLTIYFAVTTMVALILSIGITILRICINEQSRERFASLMSWTLLIFIGWSVFMMFFIPTWTIASTTSFSVTKTTALYEYLSFIVLSVAFASEITLYLQRKNPSDEERLF